MRLETTVDPGLAALAARRQLRHQLDGSTWVGVGILVGVPLVLVVALGTPWPLLGLLLPVVALLRVVLLTRAFQARSLPVGSAVATTWTDVEVVVERPTGTVHHPVSGLREVDRDDGLVVLRLSVPSETRPRWLVLPAGVVPVTLPQPPPPSAQHVAVVTDTHLGVVELFVHQRRRGILALLLGVEVLLVGTLFVLHAWWAFLALGVLVVFFATAGPRLAAQARRARPPGTVLGSSLTDRGLELELPGGRLSVDYASIRTLEPLSPRHVMLAVRRPRHYLVLPRDLFPDAVIDHVRRLTGKPPLLARQRL